MLHYEDNYLNNNKFYKICFAQSIKHFIDIFNSMGDRIKCERERKEWKKTIRPSYIPKNDFSAFRKKPFSQNNLFLFVCFESCVKISA